MRFCWFLSVNLWKQLARYPFPRVDPESRSIDVVVINENLAVIVLLRVVSAIVRYLKQLRSEKLGLLLSG